MRTRRIKAPPEASSGFYHCMSRVVDRRLIFKDAEREQFSRLMRQYARFCGIRILTHCIMGNHFHLLVEVPQRSENPPDDAILLDRISAIYKPAQVEAIRSRLSTLSPIDGNALRQRFWRRMGDISQYLKELKQRFSQWHNLRQGRRGTLWEERFRSVLIGADGSALSTIAAYIDLNPVRAGLVKTPSAYRWSGYGEAMAGRPEALAGYQALMSATAGVTLTRSMALNEYRHRLSSFAERRGVSIPALQPRKLHRPRDGKSAKRHPAPTSDSGICRHLLCRIRYFSEGAVIGSRGFVESIALAHERWSMRRRTPKVHAVSGFEWDSLFSLKAMRAPIGV